MTRRRRQWRRTVVLVATALIALAIACGALALTRAAAATRGNPLSAATATRFEIAGLVRERLAAGPYVYLRVQPARGADLWVVALRALTPPNDRVRADVVATTAAFYSARLRRTFARLGFAVVHPQAAPTAPAPGRSEGAR